MPLTTKHENILAATEDYIVHQCCCTACRPHGLSATLAVAFPHSAIYALRRPIKPGWNFAVKEDRPKPGTTLIVGNGTTERYVAAIFGQAAMGKPGHYNSGGVADSALDRQKYFQEGLADLAKQISLRQSATQAQPQAQTSLAFPYKIGCGLAGGDWKIYSQLLDSWAAEHPEFKVVLYRLD